MVPAVQAAVEGTSCAFGCWGTSCTSGYWGYQLCSRLLRVPAVQPPVPLTVHPPVLPTVQPPMPLTVQPLVPLTVQPPVPLTVQPPVPLTVQSPELITVQLPVLLTVQAPVVPHCTATCAPHYTATCSPSLSLPWSLYDNFNASNLMFVPKLWNLIDALFRSGHEVLLDRPPISWMLFDYLISTWTIYIHSPTSPKLTPMMNCSEYWTSWEGKKCDFNFLTIMIGFSNNYISLWIGKYWYNFVFWLKIYLLSR